MSKYLNLTGLERLWGKVKGLVATETGKCVKSTEKGQANGVATLGADGKVPQSQLPELDLSLYKVVGSLPDSDINEDKIYLVLSAESGTQNTYTEYIYVDSKWEKLGEYKAAVDLTNYVKFTDLASAEKAGAMSASDKAKLDGLSNYTHPAGSAPNKAEGLYKISTDGQSHVKSAVAVTKDDITALGIPAQDTTYGKATTSADGLMAKEDKSKLDGLKNVTTISTDHASDSVDVIINFDDSEQNTDTINAATATTAGVMSAADKSKLDGVATGATADEAISDGEIDEICV